MLPDLDPSICNNTTIYVTNYIFDGKDIAPMGDAATGYVHLHLYRFKNTPGSHTESPIVVDNTGDPFFTIQHQAPDYGVELHSENQTNGNISIKYPGTNAQGLKIRCTMLNAENAGTDRFSNVAMNVSRVEFRIKPTSSPNYSLIEGQGHESRIWIGATQEEVYPDFISTEYGGWSKTGQYPFAYVTGDHHAYDDFYFADFITRIHRNDPMDGNTTPTMIANCPQDARYNDGRYQLKAVVKDVRYDENADDADDHIFEGPRNDDDELAPLEFVLDNFKPFIESIEVSFGV